MNEVGSLCKSSGKATQCLVNKRYKILMKNSG